MQYSLGALPDLSYSIRGSSALDTLLQRSREAGSLSGPGPCEAVADFGESARDVDSRQGEFRSRLRERL